MVALAAALAERGIGSTLLGSRTPPAASTAATFCLRGGLLMVFALLPQDVPECVQDPAPGTTIVAAGPDWDPAALPPRGPPCQLVARGDRTLRLINQRHG